MIIKIVIVQYHNIIYDIQNTNLFLVCLSLFDMLSPPLKESKGTEALRFASPDICSFQANAEGTGTAGTAAGCSAKLLGVGDPMTSGLVVWYPTVNVYIEMERESQRNVINIFLGFSTSNFCHQFLTRTGSGHRVWQVRSPLCR